MNPRLVIGFLAALSLCACDKKVASGESDPAKEAGPGSTRAQRSRQDHAPGRRQQYSDSLTKAMGIQSPEDRDKALKELAWESLDSEPDLSLRAFREISIDNPDRVSLIQAHVARIAGESPEMALAWAAELGSEADKAVAKEEIIQTLANSDPGRAAKILGAFNAVEGEANGTASFVLRRLTSEKPLEAAAWVSSMRAGESRKIAVKILVSDWSQADPDGAFAWLKSISDPAVRGEADQAILEAFVDQTSETREAWLERANPDLRKKLDQQLEQLPRAQEEPVEQGSDSTPSE
jgi:hypothetical protein